MNLRARALRDVVLPMVDLMRGRSLSRVLDELESTQWWPRHILLAHQQERMNKLVEHAYAHVPYYREVMQSRGLVGSDIRELADLAKLPLLGRADLRRNYPARILAQDTPHTKWIEGRTGGSTGEPVFFTHDKGTLDYGRAVLYRAWRWAECPPGTAMMQVWGHPLHKVGVSKQLRRLAFFASLGIHYVDAYEFTEGALDRATTLLESGRVHFIYGYMSSIRELCQFMTNHGRRAKGVRAAMTTADLLIPDARKTIEDALGAQVFDGYGCNEINGVAYECDKHQGSHIGMERAIVEVVDENGQPLPPGQPGRLAITDLHNYAMPLIRYLNGDEGVITTDPCACGRHLDRLVSILGRSCDLIDGINGRSLYGYFFSVLFLSLGWFHSLGLAGYQIIQESKNTIRIRLVIPGELPAEEERRLVDRLAQELGPMDFQIERCDKLEVSGVGKLRWAINHVRANAA